MENVKPAEKNINQPDCDTTHHSQLSSQNNNNNNNDNNNNNNNNDNNNNNNLYRIKAYGEHLSFHRFW